MLILNLCETSIFLDDINTVIYYSRQREPQTVDDRLARKSRNLKWAIQNKWVIDVTNGIPQNLPPAKSFSDPNPEQAPTEGTDKYYDPASPYFAKQSMLVKDDHFKGDHNKVPSGNVMPGANSAPSLLSTDNWQATQQMSVVWHGPVMDAGGYARMNRRFMFGLTDRGVRVHYEKLPSLEDMDIETVQKIAKLEAVRVPPDAPKIYGMTAPLIYDWSRRRMLFTMMETRRLHKDYVIRCNCADEIIVPSKWCLDVFKESGVKVPMSVVPLGVDTGLYRPDVEPIDFSKGLRSFVFLSVFGWSLRKGYDVLLKAFLEEFTSDDDVTLLISSRYFGSTHESKKQVIRNDIARVSSMVQNPKKPQVVLFGDVLSDQMMPRLYAAADCYVLFSRGEGFGLPYLEAAACNIPVIATRYSGQTDFLDDNNSYLVDIDGYSKATKDLAWISYFYEDAEFPTLGPDVVKKAREAMRKAYENRDEAKKKSEILHQKVTREYNWNACIDKMYEKLQDTYRTMSSK